ncbi:hypothetical protein ACFWF7_37795 [Nocardia sp. NPDC060256]|uniref:hypothetical protein n=1 Tax=unclassified Nocardia TaxID=2637762 RepID=UPI0036599378
MRGELEQLLSEADQIAATVPEVVDSVVGSDQSRADGLSKTQSSLDLQRGQVDSGQGYAVDLEMLENVETRMTAFVGFCRDQLDAIEQSVVPDHGDDGAPPG